MCSGAQVRSSIRSSARKKLAVLENLILAVCRQDLDAVNDAWVEVIGKVCIPVVRVDNEDALRPDLFGVLEFLLGLE